MKRLSLSLAKLNILDEAILPSSDEGTIFVPYGTRRVAIKLVDAHQALSKEARLRRNVMAFVPLILYLLFVAVSINSELLRPVFTYIGTNYIWMYSLILGCIAFRFIKRPTHLEFGPDGLRLHWLYFFGRKSSTRISWDAITYAHLAEKLQFGLPSESLDLTISKSDLFGQKIGLIKLACFGVTKTFRKSQDFSFSIDRSHLCRETDGYKIVELLERYMPAERIDPTTSKFCKSDQQQDFTSLWLDKLSSSAHSLDALEPGAELAKRYTVIKRIGSGGQAVTYLAEDSQCDEHSRDRQVVLKEFVLPTTGGREVTQAALLRIQHESTLIKSLNHDHIIRCLDLFCEGRRAYLVLNFVNGQSLQNVVSKGGPYSPDRVIELAVQMCDLLEYLHSRTPPVVHRDFTPDNLMAQNDGSLVLIDFNVAKQMESGDATHTVVGKHSYIPPEQFRGDSSSQSDIYALGCTMYYLLTGEDPEPICVSRPKEKVVTVSDELNDIVAKCTQQDLSKRYASASEIRSDLQACEKR